ncbi:MAG: hypothetical protein ACRDVM_10720 [Acidimicrobiia bacterium]
MKQPAYYARPGTLVRDLLAVLHPPYTAWHLSYVAIGAALAPSLDWWRLAGTLTAFLLGTGVAAHALDEWQGRPLRTGLGDRMLLVLGVGGFLAAGMVAAVGAVVVSPWVLAWAGAGTILAAGYACEWWPALRTDLGFALAWGGFPVLVGFWAQAETLGPGLLAVAAAATLLSVAQRALSTPARFVRRSVQEAEVVLRMDGANESWPERRLLETWERPLRLTGWAMVLLAVGLLAGRL